MARVVLGSWMVRFPLGGNLSWTLQWLLGSKLLGHEVFLVEKAGYANSCYDPARNVMSDDCSFGVKAVAEVLERHGLGGRWCYVDAGGTYYGLARQRVRELLRTADAFVDLGTHGAWLDEAAGAGVRVLVDGEPGFTQMRMAAGTTTRDGYDRYYSNGHNLATGRSTAPAAGKRWRGVFNPVVVDLFPTVAAPDDAPFTTVMNWQSHEPLRFEGTTYGQKADEFSRYIGLPGLTSVPLEVAVSGSGVPASELRDRGWRLASGRRATSSFDAFRSYIRASRGEFTVAKNVFVETNSGWFSDRSAAYLASGRPVVMQDTGFSEHLPCGEGLFAVRSPEEAAGALDQITSDWERHSAAAREIAREHLDARPVLGGLYEELGI